MRPGWRFLRIASPLSIVAAPVGARRHTGRLSAQVAEIVEAILDQEETDALAVGRRADVDGTLARRHVERVVEQDVDVADRAVAFTL